MKKYNQSILAYQEAYKKLKCYSVVNASKPSGQRTQDESSYYHLLINVKEI